MFSSSSVHAQDVLYTHSYSAMCTVIGLYCTCEVCTSAISAILHDSSQTIKCLLIYPNPESALNEEAGRLLLEHYNDYSSRAKMMTTIHARPSRSEACTSGCDTTAKKRPLDSSATTSGLEKKKKDKKKALKRL